MSKQIGVKKIIKSFTSSWRFMFFSFWKLPMAFLAKLRVSKLTHSESEVTVPFNYWNKNPFRSMYFAVQAMAAELSTGTLAFLHTDGKNISILVTELNVKYFKKATTKIRFICLDGEKMSLCVEEAIKTGEGKLCKMKSKGYDLNDICVSEFEITWSLKKRS